MTTYGPPTALYYIMDALDCILILVGLIAGVIAIVRKRTLPGILAIVAFLMLGLQTLVSIILPRLLWSSLDYGVYNWVYFCLNTPLFLFAIIALVVLAFVNAGKKNVLPPPPGVEDLPLDQ